MTGLNKRFSCCILVLAAAISIMFGAGISRIHSFSEQLIADLFPVNYRVEYRNSVSASPAIAHVSLNHDSATIATNSGSKVIPTTDAVFTCLDNATRTQNILRSGLLSILLVILVACIPVLLCAIALSNRKIHKHKCVSHRRVRPDGRYSKPACVAATYPSVA